MASRNELWLAICLATIGLVGCSPAPEQKLMGSWEGSIIIDESAMQTQADNPAAAALAAGMQEAMKSMVANLKASAEFKADKTYTMKMPSPLGTIDSSGSWDVISHDSNTLTIRMHPENKAAFEKTITFIDANQFESRFDNGTLRFARVTAD